MTDKVFTKIASNLLVNVRDLAEWGIDVGHTTPEMLRLTVAARKEEARKLTTPVSEGGAGLSQRQAAKMLGVPRSTLQYDLDENRPESGRKPSTDSSPIRDAKEDEIKAKNEELKAVEVAPVIARYGTIVIDPPWEMEKIKRDVRPNQVAFDYPTMTEEELSKFPVGEMAEEDCHLFCWTTQKHLPAALRLVAAWRFKYVLTMVWYKPGGFQPHGLPQYNCEFVVYGRKGAPKFRDTQAFNVCFQGERREHSRKPDVFYDTVRRVTTDGRIDIFSREDREGFAQYGNEPRKFVA
jgi:N6-adenosine-specific RNA methylase IME4